MTAPSTSAVDLVARQQCLPNRSNAIVYDRARGGITYWWRSAKDCTAIRRKSSTTSGLRGTNTFSSSNVPDLRSRRWKIAFSNSGLAISNAAQSRMDAPIYRISLIDVLICVTNADILGTVRSVLSIRRDSSSWELYSSVESRMRWRISISSITSCATALSNSSPNCSSRATLAPTTANAPQTDAPAPIKPPANARTSPASDRMYVPKHKPTPQHMVPTAIPTITSALGDIAFIASSPPAESVLRNSPSSNLFGGVA